MRSATRCCGAARKVYTQRSLRAPPRPKRNTSRGETNKRSGCSVKVRSQGPPPGVGVPHCRLSTNSYLARNSTCAGAVPAAYLRESGAACGPGACTPEHTRGSWSGRQKLPITLVAGGASSCVTLSVTLSAASSDAAERSGGGSGSDRASPSVMAPPAGGVGQQGVYGGLHVAAALAAAAHRVVAGGALANVGGALPVHKLHLHVQLEAEGAAARRVLEGKVEGRSVEDEQQVRPAGSDATEGRATLAQRGQHGLPRVVAVIGHEVRRVAILDVDEVRVALPHADERHLAVRHARLADVEVAGEVTRVHAGEVRGLHLAVLLVAVLELLVAEGVGHVLAAVGGAVGRAIAQHGPFLPQEPVGEAEHYVVLRRKGPGVVVGVVLGEVEHAQHHRDGRGLRVEHVVTPRSAAPVARVEGPTQLLDLHVAVRAARRGVRHEPAGGGASLYRLTRHQHASHLSI
ncbi:hypothetical protein E2C01_055546 [Portunus trituberculatus]|uniref:Uncharacterized protein n=1 Tax=Portunus trituberculatus TaxID=210409 RepID=A0A5B7GV25_PORTR|nr:hypothetical protein [Portunus trituberculatus]